MGRVEKIVTLSRLRELLVDFPHLVKLLYRLIKDSRVSNMDKALLAAAVVYVLNPMDLSPDVIPLIGQIDDAYLLALSLLRLLSRADPEILDEHWSGKHNIVALLNEIVALSSSYLPTGIRTILLGKVASIPRQQGWHT